MSRTMFAAPRLRPPGIRLGGSRWRTGESNGGQVKTGIWAYKRIGLRLRFSPRRRLSEPEAGLQALPSGA
jgi:hypothetical protein